MERRDAIRSLALALAVLPALAVRNGAAVVPADRANSFAAAERLAAAVRVPTISREGGTNPMPLLALHALLRGAFPRAHRALALDVVNHGSLLYTWAGSDSTARPILLAAHLDVVPVTPESEARWTHPPFGGQIVDGYVWGRGTLDDKAAVLGILEAVEGLVAEGFRPRRTVYLAFGHDEEVGGVEGAAAIAAHLAAGGVRLAWLLDEGLAVTRGLLPGVRRPVAIVGVAERGRLHLDLVATGEPGHAAMPPAVTATERLVAGLAQLARHPMPAALTGPAREMFAALAPEVPPPARWALQHLWLTEPLVRRRLAASPATAGLVRTTTTVTRLVAGDKANVVPVEARAVVDLRIRPGDTVAVTLDHVRRVVAASGIDVRVVAAAEPSPVADIHGEGYQAIGAAIRQVFADTVVAPGLVLAATDARHYRPLADAAYGFVPIRFGPEDLRRVHGIDERIAVADYADAIRFYAALVLGAAGR
jgi:carboxypeptidase PM20D1